MSSDNPIQVVLKFEALINEHITGQQDHRRQLFSLLMFELWHRTFIDVAEVVGPERRVISGRAVVNAVN